jgi:hypothetical protein
LYGSMKKLSRTISFYLSKRRVFQLSSRNLSQSLPVARL